MFTCITRTSAVILLLTWSRTIHNCFEIRVDYKIRFSNERYKERPCIYVQSWKWWVLQHLDWSTTFLRLIGDKPYLPLLGQQTNSTPENKEIPHGKSMAKLRKFISRSWHETEAVWFHRSKGQHFDWLWMWSKTHFSGTSSASLWNGPSAQHSRKINRVNGFETSSSCSKADWLDPHENSSPFRQIISS